MKHIFIKKYIKCGSDGRRSSGACNVANTPLLSVPTYKGIKNLPWSIISYIAAEVNGPDTISFRNTVITSPEEVPSSNAEISEENVDLHTRGCFLE